MILDGTCVLIGCDIPLGSHADDPVDEGGRHVQRGFGLVHRHQVASLEDDPQLQQTSTLLGSHHLVPDFPGLEQFLPELMSTIVEELISPAHGARIGYDQILLAVVDEHWNLLAEKELDPCDFGVHEVSVETVVDLLSLAVENHLRVEAVDACSDALVPEVRLKQL